jgi:hypothetical protein
MIVGVTGFEPATSWSRTKRSTKLSYTPAVVLVRVVRGRGNYSVVPGEFKAASRAGKSAHEEPALRTSKGHEDHHGMQPRGPTPVFLIFLLALYHT